MLSPLQPTGPAGPVQASFPRVQEHAATLAHLDRAGARQLVAPLDGQCRVAIAAGAARQREDRRRAPATTHLVVLRERAAADALRDPFALHPRMSQVLLDRPPLAGDRAALRLLARLHLGERELRL